ncbi:hypothetical protein Tco_0939179 [Tanacetum coccineum]|uniref:Uncharacterized protein n=1 Tax=Tanacetum coccineum TaxID=301880 RepID=A0ABQ5DQH4_9ASTR
MSFHQALDLSFELDEAAVKKLTTSRLVNGSSCDRIDMVIKNLDLKRHEDPIHEGWELLSKVTTVSIKISTAGTYYCLCSVSAAGYKDTTVADLQLLEDLLLSRG